MWWKNKLLIPQDDKGPWTISSQRLTLCYQRSRQQIFITLGKSYLLLMGIDIQTVPATREKLSDGKLWWCPECTAFDPNVLIQRYRIRRDVVEFMGMDLPAAFKSRIKPILPTFFLRSLEYQIKLRVPEVRKKLESILRSEDASVDNLLIARWLGRQFPNFNPIAAKMWRNMSNQVWPVKMEAYRNYFQTVHGKVIRPQQGYQYLLQYLRDPREAIWMVLILYLHHHFLRDPGESEYLAVFNLFLSACSNPPDILLDGSGQISIYVRSLL